MSAKRLAAALVALAGATAFTACLLAVVGGMRDVVQTDGGFCASGGPRRGAFGAGGPRLPGTAPAGTASKQP